ncbi:MAG: DegT/DnrJ/EryC1/StrS family aminotransferase, partial [Candidatus Eremiobacteraeota bacterium]|nr:DegT/DnrJ/EryC1/StrS family aminotransferase [Candidatus Eremiobacteraeota bacterium]
MRDTFLPYCRPAIGNDEVAAVVSSMRNGWLTTGPQTEAFEREFAQACGSPYAVALNSCTAGLHLALIALGVGPGDEVIMPSLTFVAGAQCTLEIGAKPVFCDVDPETLSANLRTIGPLVTKNTKAIIAMPYGGRPLGIDDIVEFARPRGIAVLEDAAHGAGT